MDPNQTNINAFNDFAKHYFEKYFNLQQYNTSYDCFCESITTHGAALLELGCGPGNITRYLFNKRPDFRILASDAAPNMLALAKQNNPEAEFQELDFRKLKSLNRIFHGIVAGFCLPYLNEEDANIMLNDCFDMLHWGGVLYLSTIEGDYARSGIQTGATTGRSVYMYYYQQSQLMAYLANQSIKLLYKQRIPFPMPDGSVNTDLILILKKV
ncbi:MAG: class I SAM-dependent methyltransferase [Bacteroidia bacterium]|jgi:ubiquinone/menaquinone biosynthesis C-methylase UbiE|nr:class I SAM-dependent methyltransferase [Bacteroidia bacterium]